MATTLRFNGYPIEHLKEVLGNEQFDTTCRYYLAVDIRAASCWGGHSLVGPSTGR